MIAIIGPQTFTAKEAPRFRSAEITILGESGLPVQRKTPAEKLLTVCWSLCLLDLVFIWWYYRFQNGKKAAFRATAGYVKVENGEWLDLTDRENPELVYTV